MSNDVKKKVLLLDFAQETNSGDDVMQRAIIELCGKNMDSDFSITSYFGVNEFFYAKGEFKGYRNDYSLSAHGGFYPTLFLKPVGGLLKGISASRNILRLFYASWFLMIISLLRVKVPLFIVKFFLTSAQIVALEEYRSSDLIIWNGRNFRGSEGFSEALKIFELCANPMLCMLLGKPIVCVGSSVWTLNSPISRYLMRWVVKHSKSFIVREKSSYHYIKEDLFLDEGCKSLQYMPDLSFYFLNKIVTQKKYEFSDKFTGVVAITLVGRREFSDDKIHKNYIKAISDLIEYICRLNYKIRVIPQVTYGLESYDEELECIMNQNCDADIEVISGVLSTEGLLMEYLYSDVLVASRMHSAIFASSVGTPVSAISYDSGAKWAILDDLGIDRSLIVSVNDITSSLLIENFDKARLLGKLQGTVHRVELLSDEIEIVFKKLADML
ncbi:polysaccharide pyruvyl transferase family protein [Neptuniibacter sp. 2_MG-2023]|uniref:polysaccharide pyruvyl transferase family protein n=1 Tax=Neptuniibacter sp. 2_MG-2023 TaxID=3062671 RepID=UPI0026E21D44|nr:polysaccharide pyruvyl transferase family protein [Neptuniibacter sp. 2_MG-2023]MDO6515538.1 polysaccharide pyruvyl transferase family protein [Neptuniibacter sp. 2_MG-2023]